MYDNIVMGGFSVVPLRPPSHDDGAVMDSRVLWDCLHDALFKFPWAQLMIGPQGQFNDACVKQT